MSGVIPAAGSAAPEPYVRNRPGVVPWGELAKAPAPRSLADARAAQELRTRINAIEAAERMVRP